MDPNTVLKLVTDQNSSDNNVRLAAELQFNAAAAENASELAYHLISFCTPGTTMDINVQQSCLLHLKRIVPKYWSMGFSSFVGPPIDQKLKSLIRDTLLSLATTSTHTKIRSGCTYVIVQIAAADYPDEWPELVPTLQARASDFSSEVSVVGALAVLTDLFEDLISSETFWAGTGESTLTHITHVLGQHGLSYEIKNAALKLYHTLFNTLSSSEAMESDARMSSVVSHIKYFTELLVQLAHESRSPFSRSEPVQLVKLTFRSRIYKTLGEVIDHFSKYISRDLKLAMVSLLMEDLDYGAQVFQAVLVDEDSTVEIAKTDDLRDASLQITDYLAEMFTTWNQLPQNVSVFEKFSAEDQLRFVSNMAQCSRYPEATSEEYLADFNTFVTDASGLSSHTSVRDSIFEYLSGLNESDSTKLFTIIRNEGFNESLDWRSKEAFLFLIEGLFSSEASISIDEAVLKAYISQIIALVTADPQAHTLVATRIMLMLPRFMEKCSDNLDVNTFGVSEFTKYFLHVVETATDDTREILMASALISCTLWRNVPDLEFSSFGKDVQLYIFETAFSLMEDSDEDALPVLLEAISFAIGISHESSLEARVAGQHSIIDVIVRISFKDPSNIQLTLDCGECFQTLLTGLTKQQYLAVCEKSIPFIVDIMKRSMSASIIEYNPELFLSLEMLSQIIGASPNEQGEEDLPKDIFLYVFPSLRSIILATSDDQILQNAGEVLYRLLSKASKYIKDYVDPKSNETGLQAVLGLVAKYLSPELSDSAAMNCGLIVVSLFDKFQPYLDNEFFVQLLDAAIKRLMNASDYVTIENLVKVFCKLVLDYPTEPLMDALTSMNYTWSNGEVKNGLETVLPLWFDSFEDTREFDNIAQSILAFEKLYLSEDERIKNLVVEGDAIVEDHDRIITRSMSKNMEVKYHQISAPHKIIKMLISELAFQSKQPDPNDFITEADDGDGDWEDMNDIGVPNYEKLQSYVESDHSHDETADEHPGAYTGIGDMLVQFFKECLGKNSGNFKAIYEQLTDEEKSVLAERVIF